MQPTALDKLVKEDFPNLTPKQLQYFYDAGLMQRVLNQQENYNWLNLSIRKYLDSIGQKPRLERPVQFVERKKRGDKLTRPEARSDILSYAAEQEPGIKEFRESHLKNEWPLEHSKIQEWLQRIFEQEWKGQPKKIPPGQQNLWLFYAKPGDDYPYRIQCAPGGILEKLHDIARHLSQKFDFQEAQAVVFILTGKKPLVPEIQASYVKNNKKITLTVNLAVTSHELARFYRDVKKRIGLNRRIKTLTDKHLRLAIAACEREKNDTPWTTAFKEWNKAAKRSDRYSQESNFRRDALRARARLMSI